MVTVLSAERFEVEFVATRENGLNGKFHYSSEIIIVIITIIITNENNSHNET